MSQNYLTEQEKFWAGDFCVEYIKRNQGNHILASNLAFFSCALRKTRGLESCIEFGSNIGMNSQALKLLRPEMELSAIEINSAAAEVLEKIIDKNNIFNTSILQFESERNWDLVLIKGVLIHINPAQLPVVYRKLINATKKYLLIAEYYNPTPVEVKYRGHAERLYKRDFAGEILDQFPEMCLVDYGFVYKRDLSFPMDDVTWFLLEKR